MERPLTQNIRPDWAPVELKDYERVGGYQALRKALGSMTPKQLVELIKDSNLRGRGERVFLRESNGKLCLQVLTCFVRGI